MHTNVLSLIGYPLFIVALLEMVLGMLLLVNNPRNSRVNKSVAAFSFFAAAFALTTALMYVLASRGRDVTTLARASWIGWLMIPAAVQFVFYLRDEDSRTARIAGRVLYPFWCVVLAVSLSTGLIEHGHYSLLPHIDRSGILGKPLRIAGIIQVSWVIVEIFRLRRQMTGLRRAQLNYFTYGLLIFIIGGAFVEGVLQLFGGFGFDPCLGSYFSLPWVLLTFYAMTHHRLFDVGSVISQTLTVALSSIVLIFLQTVLFRLLEPVMGDATAIAVSLPCIGVLFLTGASINKKIQARLRSMFFPARFDYQRVMGESIRAIGAILSLPELLDFIINSIRTSLSVNRVCLYLRDGDGRYRRRRGHAEAADECEEGAVPPAVVAGIDQSGVVMIREELEEKPEAEFGAMNGWMKKTGAEAAIPLISKGTLRGILTLGQKGGGAPYAPGDIELLETLAVQAAVAIENALLYEEARFARESLEESELKFRTLAQTTPAAIFIHRGGRLLFTNRTAESMSGYTHDEFRTMHFWDMVHPDYRELVRSRGLLRLHADPAPTQYEFKVIRKDGAERWALMTAARLDYEGEPAVIGTLVDITERKALEGRLRYAQKMEAIGKLAGGVAHDFNNVLTTIVGYANLMHMKIKRSDPLRDQVDQILAATERAANMTQTLLAFGKKQVVSLASADLGDIVQRMEKLLAGLLREGVQLSISPQEKPLPILADCSQIERIIMNLLVNARDAMPSGGLIAIRTGTEELTGDFITTYGYGKPGVYAMMSVADTGIGMTAAVREKIFEPFFTTKGLDKGTGFGLSIVYDIVKEHRGYITVDSEPGKGSTFTVYLPLAREQAAAASTAAALAPPPLRGPRGGRTILVAENEEDVREFVKAVLEGHGYTVIEACDGEDACSRFTAHRGAVDLAILDVIMPKMTGNDAYKTIIRRQPGLKALFTSGYQEDVIREKGLLRNGQFFLGKPFSKNELLEAVHTVLEGFPDRVSR